MVVRAGAGGWFVMREIVYDFDEFRRKVDAGRGVHHDGDVEVLGGCVYKVTFRVYGVSKGGHVLVFEVATIVNGLRRPEKTAEELIKEALDGLEAKYARPLNSTPGRWDDVPE